MGVGHLIALTAAFTVPFVSFAHACTPADRAALLILDASASMTAKVPNGETRINVARRAVEGVVHIFPPEAQLALRVYGSQSPDSQHNCKDSQLVVPFAPAGDNKDAIIDAVWLTRAQGLTPIAYALDQARNDFSEDQQDRVIVVVSDGHETCSGNACKVASDLAAEGFVIHTVGFVVDLRAAAQLKCIAAVSGGTYFDVPVAVDLPDKLREVFQACQVSDAGTPRDAVEIRVAARE